MEGRDAGAPIRIPYLLEDGEGEVIRWFGNTITVKSAGPEVDVAVITACAGSEPPLHVHADADEAFVIVAGAVTVFAGTETFDARPGSFVFLPQGVPHTFEVASGVATLLLITAPSGVLLMYSEIEHAFGSRDMPARPRAGDYMRMRESLAFHGVTIVGPHPRDN